MKQINLFFKTLLILCALVWSGSSAWAAEGDTHDFSQSLQQLLNNNATISGINIGAQSYPIKKVIVSYRYNKTITNAVTINVSVGSTSFGTFNVNGTGNNYSTHDFTGDETTGAVSISFTNNVGSGTGKGTFYVDKVTLVEGASSDPGKQDVTLSFANSSYQADLKNGVNSFSAPQLTKSADVTVDYTSTEESVATVDASTGVVTLVGKGTTTIKATFAGNDTYNSTFAAYELTVVDTKIYSVSEARTIIDGSNEAAKNNIYVQGRISKIDGVYTDAGKKYATYRISVDGKTSSDELMVIQGKYVDNADFTSQDQIEVGDIVVILGDLKKDGPTYEFVAGNYIVTRTPDSRIASSLTWSASEVEIDKGAAGNTYTLPTLSNPQKVSPIVYTITGTDNLAVEVDGEILVDTDVEGSVTVTAAFEGNDDYRPAAASYTITVIDRNKKGTIYNPYTVADVIAMNPTSTKSAKATDVYVKGYIAGCVNTSTGAIISTQSDYSESNLALVDDPNDLSSHISVQLLSGTYRTNFNVYNHPEHVGVTQLLIKADVYKYCGIPGLKNIDEMTKSGERVTVSAVGLATFASDEALDFTNVEDLEAYVAKANGNKATLEKVNKVPANTGMLLRALNDKTAFDVPVTTTATALSFNNLFVRGAGVAVASTDGDYTNYVLGKKKSGDVGFFKANNKVVNANQAYLHINTSLGAPVLTFDDLTGIAIINEDMPAANNGTFDLQGRRVAEPTKGFYIKNGKKVVVK